MVIYLLPSFLLFMDIKEQIRNKYYTPTEEALKVYEIFKSFFGETKVDFQVDKSFKDAVETLITEGENLEDTLNSPLLTLCEFSYIILIHFPNVTITNEKGNSVDIHDLYVKVPLDLAGKQAKRFEMIVTTFTKVLYESNYTHSHLPSRSLMHGKASFSKPCLGEGPISTTCNILRNENDENIWRLFCVELARYVTVESIAGIPYYRMEYIGRNNSNREIIFSDTSRRASSEISFIIKEAIRNLINRKVFNFKYVNNTYNFADNDASLIRLISNEFITIYNKKFNNKELSTNLKELVRAKILIKAVFYKGYFTEEESNRHNFCSPSTDVLFTFKNIPVKMRIIDTNTTIEPVYILNVKYINVAIRNILEFINYNYGQKYIKETR